LLEILNVSQQKPEQTSGEPGSLSAGPAVPHSSDAPSEPVAALAQESIAGSTDVDSPKRLPEQGGAAETPEMDAPKAEAQEAEAPKPNDPKAGAPRSPGKVMIISSGDRAWDSKGAGPQTGAEQRSGMFGKRRLAALAAVVALAAVAACSVARWQPRVYGILQAMMQRPRPIAPSKPRLRGSTPIFWH